jgi:predicted transcriptional regulator
MASTTVVTLRLTAEMNRRLAKLARSTERTRAKVAAEAIGKYLDDNAWQIEAIEEGIRSAEAGPLYAHDQVEQWVKAWGTKSERKLPR